ncbi:MAG: hypothetical protein ACODAJ_16510 [Planctomycetota bacterium]
MASVKTAVSLDKPLLEWADAEARKRKISRSRLVAMALEDYRRRQENRELLQRLNASYAEEDSEEREVVRRMQYHLRDLVEGEW